MQEEFRQMQKAIDKYAEEDKLSIAQNFWGSIVSEDGHTLEFYEN